MTNNRDFYVILSSNASSKYFPNNTLTHFWNRLPQAIEMAEGEWKVGLAEFQAPVNWVHLTERDAEIKIETVNKGGGGEATETKVSIQHGRYNELRSFVKALKDVFQNETKIRAMYSLTTRSMKISLGPGTFMTVSGRLLTMLGLTTDRAKKTDADSYTLGDIRRKTVYEGRLDLDAGFHTLWIYSNACAHRMVGDIRAPLLRTVAISASETNEIKSISFDNVHYVPVSQSYFQTLEIFITDTTGRAVPFLPGQVTVTLHFCRQ